jgi:hypothetical protein
MIDFTDVLGGGPGLTRPPERFRGDGRLVAGLPFSRRSQNQQHMQANFGPDERIDGSARAWPGSRADTLQATGRYDLARAA